MRPTIFGLPTAAAVFPTTAGVSAVEIAHRGRIHARTANVWQQLHSRLYSCRANFAAIGAAVASGASYLAARGEGTAATIGVVAAASLGAVALCVRPPLLFNDGIEKLVAGASGVAVATHGGAGGGWVSSVQRPERDGGSGEDVMQPRVIRQWLNHGLLKFGRLADTPADRRVLRLWLAEEMKKKDMRDADAVWIIPTVVELMFIPGAEELFADEVRNSLTATLLRDMLPRPPEK